MRSEPDRGRLPPLVEAVPEIRQTNPPFRRQPPVPRALYEPSNGHTQFPEARSLAPSPILSSRSRPHSQYATRPSSRGDYGPYSGHSGSQGLNQLGSPGDFPGTYEGYERRGSYASTTSMNSHSTYREESPVLPPVSDMYELSQGEPSEHAAREQYSLPSIARGDERASSGTYQGRFPLHQEYGNLGHSHSHTDPEFSSPSANNQLAHNGTQAAQNYQYSGAQYLERPPYNNESGSANYLSFEAGGDYGDSKHKRRRGNLPKQVTDRLRNWFQEHVGHPYPTEEEKQMLMTQTGLTMSQISNWFINARRRNLPQMTRQAQYEANIRDHQGGH
ncbi:hypothetical protein MMC14_002813 [Varicellaria rhodocarpa]|nr:hypothetical protein [Varicellaria rhodocarpa]